MKDQYFIIYVEGRGYFKHFRAIPEVYDARFDRHALNACPFYGKESAEKTLQLFLDHGDKAKIGELTVEYTVKYK